ncbi:MAG: sulfotransferase domain-containing protein [Pseudomonadota bacterium]
MLEQKLPGTIILGAPKCGTTAMARYLDLHPNAWLSSPKEPHYFATDLPGYRSMKNLAEYQALFSGHADSDLSFEASVFYLYSRTALSEIERVCDDVKLLVMLRNPVDMVHSLHSQLLYSGDEDQEDFAQAWQLIADRKAGRKIPRRCRAREILYYDEIGKYGEQLSRVLKVIPEERIRIIRFEDFSRDTREVYKSVVEFLGLPPFEPEKFQRENPNRRHRSAFTRWLLLDAARIIKPMVTAFKKTFGVEKIGVVDRLRKASLVYESRSPISHELRQEIYRNYADDIAQLEKLLDWDLRDWVIS